MCLGSTRRVAAANTAISGWETLCGAQQNTGYSVDERLRGVRARGSALRRAHPRPAGVRGGSARILLRGREPYYKGLKETRRATRRHRGGVRDQGGLGLLADAAIAEAMGLHVIAVDVAAGKLELARDGADCARRHDPVRMAEVPRACGGADGAGRWRCRAERSNR